MRSVSRLYRSGYVQRRHAPFKNVSHPFFTFTNPLTNPDTLTKSHQESKIVPFSPEAMYDVVADVDRYHEFLPFCVESRVLRRSNENVMEAVLRIGFKVFTEAYTSRVIMKRPEKIVIKSIESPTFKRIESEWIFTRLPDPNKCQVQFKVTFEVASFLHANAIQLFFDDVAVTQLNAFIGRTAKLQSLQLRQQELASTKEKCVANSPLTQSIRSQVSAAAHTAAAIVRRDVWSQDYDRLNQVFAKNAINNSKLYFNGFFKACRDLGVFYEDFKHISENSALAGVIFSSFDISTTTKDWLDLDEFTVGVYLMTKGTVEEKAHSLFHVIDTSGDGKISREELTTAMQRRIRTVKNIFPKLVTDQVALQMEHSKMSSLVISPEEAMSQGIQAIESLMEDIEKDIPFAVNQIFLEADLDQDDFITEEEWFFAWQLHPEFVELMTVEGMKKVAQWASVVKSTHADQLETRLPYID